MILKGNKNWMMGLHLQVNILIGMHFLIKLIFNFNLLIYYFIV